MSETGDVRAAADLVSKWPVVAAYPGWRVLEVFADEFGELVVEEHHVIAWRIPPVGEFPLPVTITDVPSDQCVIQTPTDRVVVQTGAVYAHRGEWLTALKAMQRSQAAMQR